MVIMSYLFGMYPIGLGTTSLTTGIPLTNFGTVHSVLVDSGVPNIISAGTLTPLYNSAKAAFGGVTAKLGDALNNPDLKASGENIKITANSWFKQGDFLKGAVKEQEPAVQAAPNAQPADVQSKPYSSWTFAEYPDYYKVKGLSHIDPATFPAAGQIAYSAIDHLGRTTVAKGSLTTKNVLDSKNLRQQFKKGKDHDPSGWTKNTKVAIPWLGGRSYQGWMFNKSHLIADSLGGDAIRQNAITGTRTQNVGGPNNKGGMRYIEEKVHDYLLDHKDVTVYYQAEPIYEGNELLPRSVIVKAKSSDNVIDEEVEVFNTANGWTIDYNTAAITAN